MKDNSNTEIQIAGNFPRVTDYLTTALYDPQNGEIHHFHQTITFEGAEKPGENQHAEEAFAFAKSVGCKTEGLKALHVIDFVPKSAYYQVDTQTLKLIEAEPPKSPSEN